MSLHFPLPKIRTFRFSVHTSRLSLHWEVTIVALKLAMSSHFPLPKFFSPTLFPPLSNGTSRTTSDRKPKTNDQILPSPILFFPSKKWIKLIPKKLLEIEKEIVREVARGDKPYLRKSTDRKAQIRKAFVQFSGLSRPLRSCCGLYQQ